MGPVVELVRAAECKAGTLLTIAPGGQAAIKIALATKCARYGLDVFEPARYGYGRHQRVAAPASNRLY